MTTSNTMEAADEALRAACEPLLLRLEAQPQLLPLIEPELRVLLAQARAAGQCSRVALYRIEGRLKLIRRMARGLTTQIVQRPRLG